MRRGTWLIGSALTLAFAAPAQAAPVDRGVGSDPSAVIDPAGTAHIVYDAAGGETYCRLPRNAKAGDVLRPRPLGAHAGRATLRSGHRPPGHGPHRLCRGRGGALLPLAAHGEGVRRAHAAPARRPRRARED